MVLMIRLLPPSNEADHRLRIHNDDSAAHFRRKKNVAQLCEILFVD